MELFALLFLIAIGFFAGSETAFISASRIHIEIWAKRKVRGATQALYFVRHPERFLATTLIGTNIAVVACSSLLSLFLVRLLSESWALFFTTTIILIFGEIIPKTLGRDFANGNVLWTSVPLKIFQILFDPLIRLTTLLSGFLLTRSGTSKPKIQSILSRQDIKLLLAESQRSGSIERETSKILSRVFTWETTLIKEVMVPRTEIEAVNANTSVRDIEQRFISSKLTKLPVYEGTLDNIRGIIHSKDLFQKPDSIQVTVRPVLHVPETKRCQELLGEMQKSHTDFAIVIDEFGGTAGIVTLENLLEELVGDIQDEYDADVKLFRKVDSKTYILDGRARVEEIRDELGIDVPLGNYSTIAGFILDYLGRIPKKNEIFTFNQNQFQVLQSNEKLVQLIQVILRNPTSPDPLR